MRKMHQVLGIAGMYSPAPLSHKSVMNMSMTKYQLDVATMGAVMAARLAEVGVIGCTTILDDEIYARAMGKTGFWPEVITAGLGEDWAISEASIKPYPHCRHTHYALDLLSDLMALNRIRLDEIEAIEVTGLGNYVVHPWSLKAPAESFYAQFSLPYALALVALGVEPGPDWMDPDLITSKKVKSLAARVSAKENPNILSEMLRSYPHPEMRIPTKVVVRTGRGMFEANKEYARGDQFELSERMDEVQIVTKFKTNSAGILNEEDQETIIGMVLNLEKISGIKQFMDLLVSRELKLVSNRAD
jgi:2-methylcitrate dehydratase PrpD